MRRRPTGWSAARGLILALLLVGASVTPSQARILVVGDSNALGVGVRTNQAWVVRLQRNLKEYVQVFGAPGATLADPILGIGWAASCLFFDNGIFNSVRVAVLALGSNDANHDPATVRDATRKTLSWVRAPWICIIPLHQRGEDHALDAVRAVISEECTAVGAVLIDGATLIDDGDLADIKHLNSIGHAKLARAVRDAVRRLGPR